MKSPKLRFVLLLAVSLLLLAACGNAGGVGPDWDENVLVYAVLNSHHVDQAAVNRFNETHTDVQIEVRNYYDEDDPFGEKGKERLTTEILAGRIPDILDIGDGSGSLPYRQLAERGYLEDLWPYIDSDPELGRRRRNGLQMLSMTDITRIDDMQMNDLLFNGRTSYVGYPTSDGSVGSSFEPNAMHRLAISSVCRNKEAAWEFVREELLPRYNTESMKAHLSGMGSGFPINRADYELMRRMRIHNGSKFFGYTVVIGSEPVELPSLPEEDVLRLEALYNSIERIDLNDNAIYDIVWEQCTPYFTGDRSLDETVQLVQNRVQLYVSDNR